MCDQKHFLHVNPLLHTPKAQTLTHTSYTHLLHTPKTQILTHTPVVTFRGGGGGSITVLKYIFCVRCVSDQGW